MLFTLRSAGQEDNPLLAVPYGYQITQGLTAYYAKKGTQTAFISILGQGELDGVDKVYFAGDLIPEFDSLGNRNWRFHPGTFSTGFSDPLQGRPEFFPDLNFTFSGIAYIEVLLPPERSTDEEPDKAKFFVRGRKVQNYTLSGDDLVVSGDPIFSTNNALIAADIITSFMKLPTSRINGPSLIAFRDKCDELISWAGGNSSLSITGFQSIVGASTREAVGSLYRTAAGSNWTDSGAVTKSYVDSTVDSYFEVTAGEGTFAAGYTDGSSIVSNADIIFGVQCNLANVFSIIRNGVTEAHTPWSPGNVFRISIESGVFKLYVNGTEVNSSPPSVPVGTLRGAVAIFSNGAGVDASQFFPSSTSVIPGEEAQVKRYEANVVFSGTVDAASALETVMFRAPGCHWQDVDGKVRFISEADYIDLTADETMTDGGRALSYEFIYDTSQTEKPSNIGASSFSLNRKSAIDKPNFLRSSFRDLRQQYYDMAYSFVDRKALRAQAGNLIDPGLTPFGVMTQSLSDRITETQMRLLSDLDLFVNLKGLGGCETVAKGDIVKIAHDIPGWTDASPPLFMVVEETFEPTVGSGATADDRTFKLQLYNPQFYSDTYHGIVSGINITPTVSPWAPPPIVTNVELSQRGTLQPDDSITLSVDALTEFGLYPYDQYGRVWVRRTEQEREFTVVASTDLFTLASHPFIIGDPVMLSGTLPAGLDDSTLYFVSASGFTVDTFKLTKLVNGLIVDVTVDGSGNIAKFTRTSDLMHPVRGIEFDDPVFAGFTISNVQIGILKVIVVPENFFQIKRPFHEHPVWTIDVEAPTIDPPSNFNGFFDDATGDLLIEWTGGVTLQNELYELEIRDDSNTTNLRPAMLIDPTKNRHLEEYVIYGNGPDTTYRQTEGGVIYAWTGDIPPDIDPGMMVASKTSAEIVGGFLVQWQIPQLDWNPDPPDSGPGSHVLFERVGIAPVSVTDGFDLPLFWSSMNVGGGIIEVYPEGDAILGLRAIGGDFLGIYIRPDGVAEYHINYSPFSKPVFISGKSVDTTVLWQVALTGPLVGGGAVQKSTWLRQGPEWKYLQQAQRIDNSLSSSDPLPATITARVRQLAYSGASAWTTATFTR